MTTVNLFYLSLNTTGGWVTFTAHLAMCLAQMGHRPMIFKIGGRTETSPRPFGYGVHYRNVTLEDARKINAGGEVPGIITALAKQKADEGLALLSDGARIVVHDPAELRSYLKPSDVDNPWVIRSINQSRFEGESTFIRHPYVPFGAAPHGPELKKGAVSVSRIDFDKNTTLLLDANRLGADIEIRGFENRLYTRFKVCPKYPEWKQSVAAYDRANPRAAYNLMLPRRSMVDMSLIKGDGGGTQYTFLEAWDAGAVPIIHGEWILPPPHNDMVPAWNCLTAYTGADIAQRVSALDSQDDVYVALRNNGSSCLERHAPQVIVPQVMDWLRKTS